jgi:hypothetical protein
MLPIQFKYQTLFTCSVPENFSAVKDFSELLATDEQLTPESLMQIIKLSFENANVGVSKLILSPDHNHCDVYIEGEEWPARVIIRVRPSLVVGDLVFKLDELDI